MADGSEKQPDPMEIVARCIVTAQSAHFRGEEIEVRVCIFRGGTAILTIERGDLHAQMAIDEAALQQVATGMLTAIGSARHVRAGDVGDGACPACACVGAHVDGCPGDV